MTEYRKPGREVEARDIYLADIKRYFDITACSLTPLVPKQKKIEGTVVNCSLRDRPEICKEPVRYCVETTDEIRSGPIFRMPTEDIPRSK